MRLTEEQISDIVQGIVDGTIFLDRYIKETDVQVAQIVFVPLIFLNRDDRKKFAENPPAMVYAHMKDANGSRSINGYPMFGTCSYVQDKGDVKIIFERVDKIKKAMEAISKGTDAGSDKEKDDRVLQKT